MRIVVLEARGRNKITESICTRNDGVFDWVTGDGETIEGVYGDDLPAHLHTPWSSR